MPFFFLQLSFGFDSAITIYCTILCAQDSIRASDIELVNPSTRSVGVAPCFSTCETRFPLLTIPPHPAQIIIKIAFTTHPRSCLTNDLAGHMRCVTYLYSAPDARPLADLRHVGSGHHLHAFNHYSTKNYYIDPQGVS